MADIEMAVAYVQNLKHHALTKGYGKSFCKSIQCRQADRDCECVVDEVCDLIIAAIREKQERENPKPLTLEELKELKIRNWIWIEVLKPFDFPNKVSAYYQRHEFGTAEYAMKETFFCGYPGITFGFDYCDYDRTWHAYQNGPKEVSE